MQTTEEITNVLVLIEVKGKWFQCIMPNAAKIPILTLLEMEDGGLGVINKPLPFDTVDVHGFDDISDFWDDKLSEI
jgi:hypothetical protein